MRLIFLLLLPLLASCTTGTEEPMNTPESEAARRTVPDSLPPPPTILSFAVDPRTDDLRMHYRDSLGERHASLGNLREWYAARGRKMVFATNGGMYHPDRSPVGVYAEFGVILNPLNRDTTGKGNFFLRPNGVFWLRDDGRAYITPTEDYVTHKYVDYATQSGPLLLRNGQLHSALRKGSKNLRTRSGVGILPEGYVLFAHATDPINFYDFAVFFRDWGCTDALFLDGVISRTYHPAAGQEDTGGDFGVMIAVSEASE